MRVASPAHLAKLKRARRGWEVQASGSAKVEVSLHNEPGQIARVHQALDDIAARHGLPARPVARLHLALEEHLTNIMVHGYAPGQAGKISVRFALEPKTLRVEIEDDAMPFNPAEAPEVDTDLPIEERPLGGLGVLMIRRSVDALEYRHAGGRNVLVLTTRLV